MTVEDVPKVLYFAYCVNMLARRMQHCIDPKAKNLGIVKLPVSGVIFRLISSIVLVKDGYAMKIRYNILNTVLGAKPVTTQAGSI